MRPGCLERCECLEDNTLQCFNATPCHSNARCSIQDGVRDCVCSTGYRGNGTEICEGKGSLNINTKFIGKLVWYDESII